VAKDGGTIFEDELRYLGAWFEDDEFLSGDESQDCVGCCLGVLDEVAVDGERTAVQAFQFDHVKKFLPGVSSAEMLLSIEREKQARGGGIKNGCG
jgi:hypothetical protein